MFANQVINFDYTGAGFRRNGVEPGQIFFIILEYAANILNRMVDGGIKVFTALAEAHIDFFYALDGRFGRFLDIFSGFNQAIAQNVELISHFSAGVKNRIGVGFEAFVDFLNLLGNFSCRIREIFVLLSQRRFAKAGLGSQSVDHIGQTVFLIFKGLFYVIRLKFGFNQSDIQSFDMIVHQLCDILGFSAQIAVGSLNLDAIPLNDFYGVV